MKEPKRSIRERLDGFTDWGFRALDESVDTIIKFLFWGGIGVFILMYI